MVKVTFLLAFILFAITFVCGQSSATTTATTSVDIIVPISVKNNGDLTIDNFYPGNAAGFIEVKKDMIRVNNKINSKDLVDKINIPSFLVSCGQFTYSIMVSFDPVLVNRNTIKETMLIEAFSVLPVSDNKTTLNDSDEFSINAKLRLNSLQAPGQYFSPDPYKVTICFN